MQDLEYELKRLCERCKEGSYATQANRKAMLRMCAKQLGALGYRQLHLHDLKGRHVNKLLALWQQEGLRSATMKNRLSVLRWWAEKINARGILPASNDAYGLPPRSGIAHVSKAQELPGDILAKIPDVHLRMSLALQRTFGLRREESIKIKPWQADQGDRLVLQGSWTKGGRPREVPIQTASQREVIDQAKALVQLKTASLIPAQLTYVQQLHKYQNWCSRVGLHQMHGLRHAYAQDRFLELAGYPCPAAGGPHHDALTAVQREADFDARILISAELGHGREQITAAYLGR